MTEELGKIEKPPAADFKSGRKLFLVPLIFQSKLPEPEYLEKFERYWIEVETQLNELESKLGNSKKVYHELVTLAGEAGIKVIKSLHEKSAQIVENRRAKGAELVDLEDADILTEYIDWGRCLAVGLENEKVVNRVYEFYREAAKKRNEFMARRIDQTLNTDEIGILIISQGYQLQFPQDIQVFFVSPPALDEIERWLRDRNKGPAQSPPSA